MAVGGILFSAPMVRALLDGRKTQTRRVLKPATAGEFLGIVERKPPRYWFACGPNDRTSCEIRAPFAVRDLRWVRETWRCNGWATDVATIFYRASEGDGYTAMCEQFPIAGKTPLRVTGTWRPSIHMPRWASRLTIRVTGVEVERLQDISEEDAKAEGLEWRDGCWATYNGDGTMRCGGSPDPIEAYRCLWININGTGSWELNPWVVAVTFETIQANVDVVLTNRETGG